MVMVGNLKLIVLGLSNHTGPLAVVGMELGRFQPIAWIGMLS